MRSFTIDDGDLTVRPLAAADAPWLLRWLNDPAVLAYYEGRDTAHTDTMIREHFLTKTGDPVLGCLVLWQDNPIGYIQVYPIDDEEQRGYGLTPEDGSWGMDLFIGESQRWGQGIGTRLVSQVSQQLFIQRRAQRILIDPRVNNPRAVHVYQKCGFVIVKRLPAHEMHEGTAEDCWLMVRRP